MWCRKQYVRKLETIFAERQQLNMEAVGVMLPQVIKLSNPVSSCM